MVSLAWCLFLLCLYNAQAEWAFWKARLLTDGNIPPGVKDCQLVKQRIQKVWNDGLFYDCQNTKHQIQSANQTEIAFFIKLNISQLPEDYPRDLSFDFRAWYLNRLLNGPNSECQFATGSGQSIDALPSDKVSDYSPRLIIPNLALTYARDRFILVGPYNETLCSQFNETMFNQRRMYVSGCELVEKSPVPVNGYILAKYYLDATEFRCDLQPYEYYDVHIMFLQELNLGSTGCVYNGYWGGVPSESVFDYSVSDTEHYSNYENYKDQTDEEVLLSLTQI